MENASQPSAAKKPATQESLAWVLKYKPEKRLLTGQAYQIAKRAVDLVVVILTMPFWLALLALIALLIKVQDWNAPVVFTQLRTGKGGERIRMYKFRTMVPNAEELKVKYMHLNELQWPDFKIKNDPRVTRLGRILRKTSLDELPQMFNVLKGEMSLVGPRPTSFGAETYRLWQTERLDVTPGLTGLWQIVGRGSTEFDERLRLDILYIERRCLMLDTEIFFRTFTSVLKQKGAH